MTTEMEEAARQEVADRFTNGKRRIATEDDLRAKWGLSNERLHCQMCAHVFTLGEGWRWQYMNSTTPSYGNFIVCDSCDGPDVKERWLAAGRLAYAPFVDEMVLANKLSKAVSDREKEIVRKLRDDADNAYCDYIAQMRKSECLGEEAKMKAGTFGKAELDAHRRASELLGRHRALANLEI